jgi:membrane associated rhomboid family serine protease
MNSLKITPVVRNLLLINVIVFLLQAMATINLPQYFALWYFESSKFEVWQFITYMFLHGNEFHLLSNILGLIMIGPWIERVLGSQRFLTFYMLCGIGAGFLNYAIFFAEVKVQMTGIEKVKQNPTEQNFIQYYSTYHRQMYEKNPDKIQEILEKAGAKVCLEVIENDYKHRMEVYSVVGASGAIFGILMAFMLIFPNVELMLLFFPIPIKAKYLITIYILYELWQGVYYSEASNVAHFAHLGGALIAFILIKIWKIRRQY